MIFFFNENLGCFQVLATMCRAALNTGRLITAQGADVITFGTISSGGLALYGVVAFSIAHPTLYCLSLCARLPFLVILLNFAILHLFGCSQHEEVMLHSLCSLI